MSPIRAQPSTARSSFGDRPTLLGPASHSRRPHQWHCGTGIWRDRDIAAGRRDLETPCASLPTRSPNLPRTAARKAGVLDPQHSRGRETDSLLEGDGFEPSVPRSPVSSVGAACRSCLRGSRSGSARFLVLGEILHRAGLGHGLSRLWLAALRGGFAVLAPQPILSRLLPPDAERRRKGQELTATHVRVPSR